MRFLSLCRSVSVGAMSGPISNSAKHLLPFPLVSVSHCIVNIIDGRRGKFSILPLHILMRYESNTITTPRDKSSSSGL